MLSKEKKQTSDEAQLEGQNDNKKRTSDDAQLKGENKNKKLKTEHESQTPIYSSPSDNSSQEDITQPININTTNPITSTFTYTTSIPILDISKIDYPIISIELCSKASEWYVTLFQKENTLFHNKFFLGDLNNEKKIKEKLFALLDKSIGNLKKIGIHTSTDIKPIFSILSYLNEKTTNHIEVKFSTYPIPLESLINKDDLIKIAETIKSTEMSLTETGIKFENKNCSLSLTYKDLQPSEIPDLIKTCSPDLSRLVISRGLNSDEFLPCLSLINRFKNLETLILNDNKLGRRANEALLKFRQTHSNLRILSLAEANNLQTLNFMNDFENLVYLDLWNAGFNKQFNCNIKKPELNEGAKKSKNNLHIFAEAIANSKLNYFAYNGCYGNVQGIELILLAVSKVPTLLGLRLGSGHGGDDADTIKLVGQRMNLLIMLTSTIIYLDIRALRFNKDDDKKPAEIAKAIEENVNLLFVESWDKTLVNSDNNLALLAHSSFSMFEVSKHSRLLLDSLKIFNEKRNDFFDHINTLSSKNYFLIHKQASSCLRLNELCSNVIWQEHINLSYDAGLTYHFSNTWIYSDFNKIDSSFVLALEEAYKAKSNIQNQNAQAL